MARFGNRSGGDLSLPLPKRAIMKKILGIGAIVLGLVSLSPHADAQTSNATASSSATSGALNNAGNTQGITFNSTGSSGLNYSGSYSVKSTGTAVLPGFSGSFSSDYCGATAGVAGGGMGFAFSAGAPIIDQACVMLRTFERSMQAAAAIQPVDATTSKELRSASLEILAEINPKVRAIFEKRNLIPKVEVPVVATPTFVESR